MASFVWPTNGPITSPFGTRTLAGLPTFHNGIDIGAPDKSSVVASASGNVTSVGMLGAGGNTVVIDHGGGLTTLYCHLSQFNVKKGDRVSQGQIIALSGGALGELGSGNSTGPHLHFEVRDNGKPVNPLGFLTGASSMTSANDAKPAHYGTRDNPLSRFDSKTSKSVMDSVPLVGAAKGVVATSQVLGKVGGFITEPSNWKRVGMGLLGSVIILISLLELLSSDGAVQTIAKVA